MNSKTVEVLNRLLRTVYRSLPAYTQVVHPWMKDKGSEAFDLLGRIAADDNRFACRLAETIQSRGGTPQPGTFPMEFTDLHDVSLDFLLQQVIERQGRDLATIECCAADLASDPQVQGLTQNLAATARRHLELLQQAAGKGP